MTQDNKVNGYLSFPKQARTQALEKYSGVISKFDSVQRKVVAEEVVDNIHVRQPFTKDDYLYFRPNEAIGSKFADIIHQCRGIYKSTGIVRNVIDLMTDFVCEDLKIVHPNKKQEIFFKVWANKVKLYDVINEFARHLLVDGNVVIRRVTAKLSRPLENFWLEKTQGTPDFKESKPNKSFESREIPFRYVFLDVTTLQWVGGDIGRMSDSRKLAIKFSNRFMNSFKSNKKDMLKKLPLEIRNKIQNGQGGSILELDMDKIHVSHSKKDSWEDWATPFLVSILGDIFFKNKLRQAELSTLDGVINVIRLWRLGDHKEGVLPNDGAIDRLLEILNANTGGGSMDIVWDSMIDMEPFYPPVGEILGSDKYEQVNQDILVGLGIPEVLIGGKGANFSNAFIQLKTVVEKLQDIRRKILEFILPEVELVTKSMGFDQMPIVRFNPINMHDENITKRLIVGLLDRGIISVEAVLESYGEDFLIEMNRIKEQEKILKDSKVEVKSPFDSQEKEFQAPTKQGGRPTDTKETNRKTREAKPRTSALFGLKAIEAIDTYIIPEFMESIGVKNARKLTHKQREDIDVVRTCVLSCIKLGDDLSKDSVLKIAESSNNPNFIIINNINKLINSYYNEHGANPTLQERKTLEAMAWAEYQS